MPEPEWIDLLPAIERTWREYGFPEGRLIQLLCRGRIEVYASWGGEGDRVDGLLDGAADLVTLATDFISNATGGGLLVWRDPDPPIELRGVRLRWDQLVAEFEALGISPRKPPTEDAKHQQFIAWMAKELDEYGSYPPQQPSPKDLDRMCRRVWAKQNGADRDTVEEWAKPLLEVRRGRPPN